MLYLSLFSFIVVIKAGTALCVWWCLGDNATRELAAIFLMGGLLQRSSIKSSDLFKKEEVNEIRYCLK